MDSPGGGTTRTRRLSNLLSNSPQYRSSESPETKLVSRIQGRSEFNFQRAITIDVKNESKVREVAGKVGVIRDKREQGEGVGF